MRAVLLVAALVALAGPTLAEERVLHCVETGSAGFIWEEEQTEGRRIGFGSNRFVVKVLSEKKRTVTWATGKDMGRTDTLTCGKSTKFFPGLLACDDGTGTSPWLFDGNKFVSAYMLGAFVGGSGSNIIISYGICTGF